MAGIMERSLDEWPAEVERLAAARPDIAGELRSRFELLLTADVMQEDPTPERLGEFEDLVELGRGGMGIVYRASEPALQREVALKVIRPERLFFDGARARFRREVEATARLSHPGIVKVHAVGKGEDEPPHFSMELLRGETLAELVRRLDGVAPERLTARDLGEARAVGEGSSSWPLAVARLGAELAAALQHAHERDVVHRDVKPSNVMLEESGRVVLLDFGLTSSSRPDAARFTATGHPVGTLVYMAPEQVEGSGRQGPALDIYGLAVTLYELLALQPAFEAPSAVALGRAVLEGDTTPLRARNRTVPRALETVIAQAMERRPGDRYGTAAAFGEDLWRVVRGEDVMAAPPGPWTRMARRVRRRPAAALGALLALLVLVVGPVAYALIEAEHARDMTASRDAEREARLAAEAASTDLERILGFTSSMFEAASPDVNGGDVPDAVEMLHRGAAEMEGALGESTAVRGRVHLMLGRLFSALLEPAAAKEQLEQAIEVLEAGMGPGSDARERLRYADALRMSAHNRTFTDGGASSVELAEEALAIATDVHGEGSPYLMAYLQTVADVARIDGRFGDAVEARRAAYALVEDGEVDSDAEALPAGLLGADLLEVGLLDEGVPLLESAVAWYEAEPERASTKGDGLCLALAEHHVDSGEPERGIERLEATRARLAKRQGSSSLLTVQATISLGRALTRTLKYEEALALFEEVAPAAAERLPAGHEIRVRLDHYRLATLTALGRSPEVIALEAEADVTGRVRELMGETSDDHRRVLRAVGLATQAQRDLVGAHGYLEDLEEAERGAEPWSAGHADAALMLAAHRMMLAQTDRSTDHAALLTASEELLREMIEEVGHDPFPVRSSTNDKVFEGGYMARVFLAGLLDGRGAREEAAALRSEAEARKARVMR